ncbi:hypothetical protein TRVA0_049S00210 [Trichomonascus vanleenenianus]|uniref:uncharacterized protein n=1 Tax=Trichomonascus vanleenenianus TaxID=2268995 RepID=UPI003EC9DE63
MSDTPHLVARRRDLRELVGHLTGADSEEILDRTTARVESFVKRQTYGSVDPSSVVERLYGLVEKFEVVGRRDLARALRSRVEQAQELGKCLSPRQVEGLYQVLSLVLNLPGSPLALKELPILELASSDEEKQEKDWKWSEIVAEEPLTGEHWADFNDQSSCSSSLSAWSDEEELEKDLESAVDEDIAAALANMTIEQKPIPIEKFAISRPKSTLDTLKSELYYANSEQGNGRIAEANILKECILMLQGLPTKLFLSGEEIAVSTPLPYELSHLSSDILTSILKLYAKTGTLTSRLRTLIDEPEIIGIPSISGALERFYSTEIEPKLEFLLTQLLNDSDEIVSLIRVHTVHLTPFNRLLNPLLGTLRLIEAATLEKSRVVHALDVLYNSICRLQLSYADPPIITVFSQLFSTAFDDYASIVNDWISHGKTGSGFFIDRGDQGINIIQARAPVFFAPFTKSLRQLGDYTHLIKQFPQEDDYLKRTPTNKFATNPIPDASSFLSFSDELFQYLQREMINYGRDLEVSLYNALMSHSFQQTYESICEVYLIQDSKGIISDFIYTLCDYGTDISSLSRHTIDYHLDQAIERYERSLPCKQTNVSIDIIGSTTTTVLLSTAIPKPLASTIFTKQVLARYTFIYRFLFKSLYALKLWTMTKSNQSKFYRLSSIVTALQLFISSQIREFRSAISSPVDIYKLHDDFLTSVYDETVKYVKSD